MICKKILPLLLVLSLCLSLIACGKSDDTGSVNTPSTDDGGIKDDHEVVEIPAVSGEHSYTFASRDGDVFTFTCADCGASTAVTVTAESGTTDAVSAEGSTLTFGTVTENSFYTLTGTLWGNLVVDVGDLNKVELSLCGLSLYAADACPIEIRSGDKVTLSAKKGTSNYIYDLREAVGVDGISAAVYAVCDLDLQGKGGLYIKSENNNGVHTKDDLSVQNLFLQVECLDNALKGNDSVTVTSGTLVLIASEGDGIKTINTDISQKGKQRGIVTLLGGDILIYAAKDGIDAAYDVVLNEAEGSTLVLNIHTEIYAKNTDADTASVVTDTVTTGS